MTLSITKYPQSCLVVETGNARLLFDPGKYAMEKFGLDDFGSIDAVLYTHRHADHFQIDFLDSLVAQGARIITNSDVAMLLQEFEVTVLSDGESTTVGKVHVRAHDIAHCVMVDGTPGPPNTGFIIDERFLHPGDGIEATGTVEVVAVPIAGPSISMRDSYLMLEAAQARHAIPIHYDGFIARPEQLDQWCKIAKVHVLGNAESVVL